MRQTCCVNRSFKYSALRLSVFWWLSTCHGWHQLGITSFNFPPSIQVDTRPCSFQALYYSTLHCRTCTQLFTRRRADSEAMSTSLFLNHINWYPVGCTLPLGINQLARTSLLVAPRLRHGFTWLFRSLLAMSFTDFPRHIALGGGHGEKTDLRLP